jgi:hypothetical protein
MFATVVKNMVLTELDSRLVVDVNPDHALLLALEFR